MAALVETRGGRLGSGEVKGRVSGTSKSKPKYTAGVTQPEP